MQDCFRIIIFCLIAHLYKRNIKVDTLVRLIKSSTLASEFHHLRNDLCYTVIAEIVKNSFQKILSANSRPSVGQLSTVCWLTVGQQLVDRRHPVGQQLQFLLWLGPKCWSTVGNMSVTCRLPVGGQTKMIVNIYLSIDSKLSTFDTTVAFPCCDKLGLMDG